MKKRLPTLLAALTVAAFGATAHAEVLSLRGENPLDADAKASDPTKQLIVQGGIERSYTQQPPVIPHDIEKDTINLKVNTCLNCHSEKTYEEKKAPKVGDSHYVTRDGEVLKTISSRRYFCEQCHVLQVNADPLVQNNFQGAK